MKTRIMFCLILLSVLVLATTITQARYLNSSTGRFQTMDSYEGNNQDPASLHKYLYCSANPVNGVDPTGNFTSYVETQVATSISVGLSAFVSAGIAKTAVSVKQGIDVQALANRLRVPVKAPVFEEDDPSYLYFLHGTSLKRWGMSLAIDPELGTGRDFGRGFYTFAANLKGIYWAGDWARESTVGLFDVPIVIVLKIKRDDFASLSKKDFRDPALAPGWQPFVKMCRTERRHYAGAGVVIGPVSNGNKAYPEVHPYIDIPQYKFESGASKLEFAWIYPAWGSMEASP